MADRLRFYMDEHVSKVVTEGLRRRGVDVITVQELGLQTTEDARHLERAAQDGRVVVTQDADFLRLHASGLPHRGIVYAHQQTPVSIFYGPSCYSTCGRPAGNGLDCSCESAYPKEKNSGPFSIVRTILHSPSTR